MSLRIDPHEKPTNYIYQALHYINKIPHDFYSYERCAEALLYIAKYDLVDQALKLGYGIRDSDLLPPEDKYAVLWWVSGMSRIPGTMYHDFSIVDRELLITSIINRNNEEKKEDEEKLRMLPNIELIYFFLYNLPLYNDIENNLMTGYVKINFKHPYNAMFAATHINLYQSFLTDIRCIPPYYIDVYFHSLLDPKTISLLETMNIDNLPLIKNRLGLISYDNMFEKKDVQRWSLLLNRDFKQEVNNVEELLTDYEIIQHIGSIEIPKFSPDFPSIPINVDKLTVNKDYFFAEYALYFQSNFGLLDGTCIRTLDPNFSRYTHGMDEANTINFLVRSNEKFWQNKNILRAQKYNSLVNSKLYIEEDKKEIEETELKITCIVTFKNGILNGPYKLYNSKFIYSLGNIIDGERDGLWIIGTDNGEMFRYYKNGTELSEFQYKEYVTSVFEATKKSVYLSDITNIIVNYLRQ